MPDLLTTLDHRWDTFAASPRGHKTLLRWKLVEPTLARIPTLDALTDAARDIEGADLDARDELHLDLLRVAALALTARRYADTWAHDEAVSLVVEAALHRIIHYPHGVARPAATVLRFVRRAMWKQAQRHRARERVLGHTTVLDDETAVPADNSGSPADELLDLIDQALRAGAVDPGRARLVILHRILSVPTAVVADLEGYPPSTIRQRRSRAEAALAHHATKWVA